MRMIVPLVALWALTAAASRGCWTVWRRGSDRLWAARWGSLAWTLLIGDLAVTTTLAAFDAAPLWTGTVALTLLLAAAACAVAKPIATRRADTATRALRSGLGLPLARPLRRPTTLALWWLAAGGVSMTAWLLIVVAQPDHDATHAAPSAAPGSTLPHGYVATGAVLTVLGLAHCAIQEERIRREQRRVRAAEQLYLNHTPAPAADHPTD